MEILSRQMPASYELILFGDTQEGNTLQYGKGFNQAIDYILNRPNRFAIHMGDAVEGFFIDDPRYTPATLKEDPLAQAASVIEKLQPLADSKQLLTLLVGNHEWNLYKKAGNITRFIAKQLGIPYGGYTNVFSFLGPTGELQFKGYFTHGRKSIRSIADDPIRRDANEQLQLKQHLKAKMGDCLLMAKGHTHKLIVAGPHEQVYLLTEEMSIKEKYTHSSHADYKYIHPDHRWYVNTGSFLKTFEVGIESYSEMAEYDPIELGYAVALVVDGKLVNVRKVTL